MRPPAILAAGAVVTALVLTAGGVTVASALTPPSHAVRVLEDDGVDTSAAGPATVPAGPPTAPGEPAGDSVVAVPPAGPVVLGHGDQDAADDAASAPGDAPAADAGAHADDTATGASADDPSNGDAPAPESTAPAPGRTPGADDRTGRDAGHRQGPGDGAEDDVHGGDRR